MSGCCSMRPATSTRLRRLADDARAGRGCGGRNLSEWPHAAVTAGGPSRQRAARPPRCCRTGTALDLDAGADTIATALTCSTPLPRNAVAALPSDVVRRSPDATQTRQDGPGATKRAANDHRSLQRRDGSPGAAHRLWRTHRRAVSERSRALHCPCGQHRNGDAHASLEIQPARNPRYGQSVAVGYAPGCAFSLEQRRVVDAFAVYCHFEQLTRPRRCDRWRGRGSGRCTACLPALSRCRCGAGGAIDAMEAGHERRSADGLASRV